MQIHDEKSSEGTLNIRLSGDITGLEAVGISKRIERGCNDEYNRIVIDISEVSGMDSTAIGGFLFLAGKMKKTGVKLVLYGPQDHVKTLFRDCCLDKVLTVTDVGYETV